MSDIKRNPFEGLRNPITGLRKPITGLRTPLKLSDITDPNMTWDKQFAALNNYIKFAAGQVVSGLPSAMLGSDDLYQEGLILLYQCFEKYRFKPESEFQTLFKTSLWRKLRGFCYKKPEVKTVDLDEVFDLGYTDTIINDMYEEYRVQQVLELIKSCPLAVKIFQEVLYPSQGFIDALDMDIARKETIQSQGRNVHVPSEISFRKDVLRKYLGITESEFSGAFKQLQSSVYAIYSEDSEITNYREYSTGA
jgi:hypothetical protein